MEKVNIYFGAPLFNSMEREFNARVVKMIRERLGDKVSVYLPQENTEINDKSKSADSVQIFEADTERLEETNILIAVLDGPVADVGLAAEVGYFACMSEENPYLTTLGLYTDIRQGDVTEDKVELLNDIGESQWSYINLYLLGAIKANGSVVSSVEDLVDRVEERVYELIN